MLVRFCREKSRPWLDYLFGEAFSVADAYLFAMARGAIIAAHGVSEMFASFRRAAFPTSEEPTRTTSIVTHRTVSDAGVDAAAMCRVSDIPHGIALATRRGVLSRW